VSGRQIVIRNQQYLLLISSTEKETDCSTYSLALAFIFLASTLFAQAALASGTPAGTDIVSQATATYTVSSIRTATSSNLDTTRVAELLDIDVVWQDAARVVVNPGDVDQVLTFLLVNTGNGADVYALRGLSTLAGDDFDPILRGVFLDINDNGMFDLEIDQAHVPGVNDPELAAGESVIIFVLNDIPAASSDGDLGNSSLNATSKTGAGPPGTVIAGAGERGTDGVIGNSGGTADRTGTYAVSGVIVSIVKSASVADPSGGSDPLPGAVITYSIVVTIGGSGTVREVVVTDPIPPHTAYNPGSLTLNATALTDEADGDVGDVDVTIPGTVVVNLGNSLTVPTVQVITFRATII
jgi:uncharacterized repeat protein (TIGR01451 family)